METENRVAIPGTCMVKNCGNETAYYGRAQLEGEPDLLVFVCKLCHAQNPLFRKVATAERTASSAGGERR